VPVPARLSADLLGACALVGMRRDGQLASAEELIDGVSQGALGEILIRYAAMCLCSVCAARGPTRG
jgi:hypothetical protein